MKINKAIEQDVGITITSFLFLDYLKKEFNLSRNFISSLKFSDIMHHFVLPLISIKNCQSNNEWSSQEKKLKTPAIGRML